MFFKCCQVDFNLLKYINNKPIVSIYNMTRGNITIRHTL